jgi:HK97 family phage prohead protease
MEAKPKIKRQVFFQANSRITFRETKKKFANGTEGPVTTLMGYPILWNEISSDRGGYSVRIPPAAAINFAKPCFALFNHDFGAILGNTANGSLRLGQPDATGIPVEIDLPDTNYGRDTAALVRDGYCQGMSFSMVNGFEKYAESKDATGKKIVDVSQFTCDDITITPIPAFDATTIGPKDDDDDDEEDMSQAPTPVRIGASAKLHQLRLSMLK